jgi:hypothetical protein
MCAARGEFNQTGAFDVGQCQQATSFNLTGKLRPYAPPSWSQPHQHDLRVAPPMVIPIAVYLCMSVQVV